MPDPFIQRIVFIVILLIEQLLLTAQPEVLHFSRLTREEGLPSNRTRCVIQDFRGYVWIGTDNGLARYDGHNITVFRHDIKDSTSVIDNCINELYETHDSILLVGAIDGLSVYNPFTKEFTGYSMYRRGNSHFPAKAIICFHEDTDGSIWIGTETGLVHMNRQPVAFTWFSLRKSENKTDREYFFNEIYSIIQHPGDKTKLIIATHSGLLLFDKTNHTVADNYKSFQKGLYGPVSLCLDDNHHLWSCGWNAGLNCLDLETGKWHEYPFNKKRPYSILEISKKSRDELWLATIGHGLGVFNTKDHTIKFHEIIPGNDKSLLSTSVIGMKYLNKSRDLWIISDDGINILDQQYQSFTTVPVPFKNKRITIFYRDKKSGCLYVGAADCNGLFCRNERTKKWTTIPPERITGKSEFSFLTIFKDSRSVLWLGTKSGLYYLNPECRKFREFRMQGGEPLLLKYPAIYSIMEDRQSNLWIGTFMEGVFTIDSTRSRIKQYRYDPRDPTGIIDGGRIHTICSDRRNNIWIATDNGVSIYNPVSKKFNNNLADSLKAFGITKRWINGIETDTLGRMWLTIDAEGLVRVEVTEKGGYRFKVFNTSNGMNGPTPGTMTMDAHGGLWLINYGLLYINPYTESIKLFDEHNGLVRTLSYDEGLYIDDDGNIYIGGKDKYETRNIHDLDFSPLNIRLLLESIEINGKNVSTGQVSGMEHQLVLSASQNNILFRYTGVCFQDVDQILFRYKLEGYDNDWIMAGASREARYTNLPHGKYRFVFQVFNRGQWLNQESSFCFTIRPLFWKTWWFIILAILVTGFVLFSIYQYKVRELLRLERMRTRIATDLHDDVGSTLSSIFILSDILAQQIENPQSAKIVGTIGANAHKMLEKIDDIVWLVNPSNDKFQNLGLRIREFAIPLFESRNIEHEIYFDKQLMVLQLKMEVRRNIYLIAKEAVNNAIKYAECKTIHISFRYEHQDIVMQISDDGKGFNTEVQTSRNGIKNMKMRAEQMGAVFEINSTPGKGTKINLKVKLL